MNEFLDVTQTRLYSSIHGFCNTDFAPFKIVMKNHSATCRITFFKKVPESFLVVVLSAYFRRVGKSFVSNPNLARR